ncbi:MAG: S8 family serine peptidase [Bacteroidia bacterium]
MRPFSLFIGLLSLGMTLQAQVASTQRYLVQFADKDLDCDPSGDFDQKALERRMRHGVAFPMWEDFPVTAAYIDEIQENVTQLRHVLRWWNGVTMEATQEEIEQVSRLPFVLGIEAMERMEVVVTEDEAFAGLDKIMGEDSLRDHLLFGHQRTMVGMSVAEAQQLSGKGLRIAVFDAGFSGADSHPAFSHLYQRSLVKGTRDFVAGDADVYAHSNHGTAVWSCIAGMYEGKRLGAAVDAEFLLCRTELNLREIAAEEDHWMAAAEWADQQGADIISSSLGYGRPRHAYNDMDGQRTLVSRAAAMAVRKGILVVNSAGNEGVDKFHYITAPGDIGFRPDRGRLLPYVARQNAFLLRWPKLPRHPQA